MAMRDEDRVVVRLSVADRRDLDRLRGPFGRASFLRTLLRRAAEQAQDGDRDDAPTSLASLAAHDAQASRVLRQIERPWARRRPRDPRRAELRLEPVV